MTTRRNLFPLLAGATLAVATGVACAAPWRITKIYDHGSVRPSYDRSTIEQMKEIASRVTGQPVANYTDERAVELLDAHHNIRGALKKLDKEWREGSWGIVV